MMPEVYNQFGAMHGTIMVFLGVVPLAVGGFGNYVMPLQIGAPDMAFPKLNMMSYWVYFVGGVIMLALVDGVPHTLSLRQVLDNYVEYQKQVITRRTKYELAKAEERAHILEGYVIALDNIDEEFDNAGFTYNAGYQYAPLWYLKIGANLEYFPDLAGSKHPVLAPELLVTAGGLIYGGVGGGI